jgi:hypothetical protein
LKFLEADDKKENITYRDKVFFTLIEELSNNSTQDKFYANLIKNYIRKYILVYDKENSFSPRDTITMKPNLNKNDYDNFLNYLKEINIICKSNNESNFMTDLVVYLVKTLYDGVFPANHHNLINDFKSVNNFQTIATNVIDPHFNNFTGNIFHFINRLQINIKLMQEI